MGSRWLHPVHYAFVGADLCLFFLLLLALAEHFGFRFAYAVAAAATAGSIALYARAILGSTAAATTLLVVMAGLFGFIFVLLSAETYALLLGAVGLFVLLVAAMYTTRRLDWYDLRPRRTRSGT
jgi:inner membrane protein